jgi:hypothetical protein
MRTLLLASAAALALGGVAYAQNARTGPFSPQAANIAPSDTHSVIAPALPSPGAVGSPEQYLQRANQALRAGRTGEAQEALERAETRLLDRSVSNPSAAAQPDNGPRIDAIQRALHALANHDRGGAMNAVQMAMNNSGDQNMKNNMGGTAPGMGTTSPMMPKPANGTNSAM